MNPIDRSFVTTLNSALKQEAAFTLTRSETSIKVEWISVLSRLQEKIWSSCRLERIGRIAEILDECLQAQSTPPQTMLSAEKDPLAKATRTFLRSCKKEELADPRIVKLQKQLQATRLAIKAEVFDANEGFYDFASKTHLERYLMHYNHTLDVDPKTNKLSIWYNENYIEWTLAKSFIIENEKESLTTPKSPWKYGMHGIQNSDLYDWSELKPYKTEDPANWNHQYLLELCACCVDSPRKNGDHSWFRLKTPTGEVYSVGLYRPEKRGPIDNFRFPLKVKHGYLMQPDVSEFFPTPIQEIKFSISKEIFDNIVKKVEEDKRNERGLHFQAISNNCTQYTNSVAAIAGVTLPTDCYVWKVLCPEKALTVYKKTKPYTPTFVTKISIFSLGILFNFLQLILGARRVDSRVLAAACTHNRPTPHFSRFWDFFNSDKARMHHPHTLGHSARKKVLKERQKMIEAVRKQNPCDVEDQVKRIEYSIPEKFRLATS